MEKGDFFVVLHTTSKTPVKLVIPEIKIIKLTKMDWLLYHVNYECKEGMKHEDVQTEILVKFCEADPNLQVKQVSKMTEDEFYRMNEHIHLAKTVRKTRKIRNFAH